MNGLFAPDALSGKTLLVTGASSGIGRATAVLASRCGARLVLLGRSKERLEAVQSGLAGKDHAVRAADLSGSDEIAAWLRGVFDEEGPIDGVFHSAGIGLVRPIKITKAAQIDEVMAASVGGTFALARAVSGRGAMPVEGGSVVLMSSVAGSRGQSGMSIYSASKGAIDAAVRSLSCELASRRIRVNSIVAGAVRTEMHERITSAMAGESIAEYEGKHLLGFGESIDIAHVAVFLLSDAARWVTGANWVVDGGYLAK